MAAYNAMHIIVMLKVYVHYHCVPWWRQSINAITWGKFGYFSLENRQYAIEICGVAYFCIF